jgi:hypothetical protein
VLLRRACLVVIAALLMTLLAASAAEAIPVRFLSFRPGKPATSFSVRLISPAAAGSCYAASSAKLIRVAPTVTLVRILTRRIWVCQTGRVGFTSGVATGTFNTATQPAGRYRVCVTASQRRRTGTVDIDTTCSRIFSL